MPNLSFQDYWRTRVEIATAQLRAAGQVIRHGGTRGTIAETVLRTIITDVLPVRYEVGNGFILGIDNTTSDQIDLLVYDRLRSAPIYRDGLFAVTSPDMAVMAVESKSDLNATHFRTACDNIASVKAFNPAVVGVVFGFRGMQPSTMRGHLQTRMPTVLPEHRVDLFMNLRSDFVVELDRSDRRTFNCRKGPGVAINPLLFQTVLAAEVLNLRAYLNFGLPFTTPFSVTV